MSEDSTWDSLLIAPEIDFLRGSHPRQAGHPAGAPAAAAAKAEFGGGLATMVLVNGSAAGVGAMPPMGVIGAGAMALSFDASAFFLAISSFFLASLLLLSKLLEPLEDFFTSDFETTALVFAAAFLAATFALVLATLAEAVFPPVVLAATLFVADIAFVAALAYLAAAFTLEDFALPLRLLASLALLFTALAFYLMAAALALATATDWAVFCFVTAFFYFASAFLVAFAAELFFMDFLLAFLVAFLVFLAALVLARPPLAFLTFLTFFALALFFTFFDGTFLLLAG